MSPGLAGSPKPTDVVAEAPDAAFEAFLDQLMLAESSGRDDAANPRSTALGPFQFIESTFIEVARRHFAADVANLDDEAVLALRTDRSFARRAASAFCKDNVVFLSEQGLKPTFGHLRLAFLVGPTGAARLLQALPTTPVAELLSDAAIAANPFMTGMSAAALIARAARDVSGRVDPDQVARGSKTANRRTASHRGLPPGIVVRCNRRRPSCRKWIALRVAKYRKLAAQKRQKVQKETSGRENARPGA